MKSLTCKAYETMRTDLYYVKVFQVEIHIHGGRRKGMRKTLYLYSVQYILALPQASIFCTHAWLGHCSVGATQVRGCKENWPK